MPTEKLVRILSAKSTLTVEQIESMTEAEGVGYFNGRDAQI